MRSLTHAAILLLGIGAAPAATDLWDLPPLRYSDTRASDPIAKPTAGLTHGTRAIKGNSPLEKLRYILNLLQIPEESQILVYSKTSHQNALIQPGNPRSLFFNENAYVGYVPGGDIEVIAHDPLLGSIYYLIETGTPSRPPRISRDTSQCLSCHGTTRTESAPGVLIRSVFPDADGHPMLAMGTFRIDHTSPIRERWGGYYVTGSSALPHLGNRVYQESARRSFPTDSPQLDSLAGTIDTSRYPRATSDIVSLMVLEHQCAVHNHLASAALTYRRAHWFAKSIDPASDPDTGTAGRLADEAAQKIVDLLLFENEASLGDGGIEGDPAFQDAFTRRFPKSADGRSLADFQLNDRIFKHRCSYMVYSSTFDSLPPRIKSAVISRLRHILESDPSPENHPSIHSIERRKILSILSETLPAWNAHAGRTSHQPPDQETVSPTP